VVKTPSNILFLFLLTSSESHAFRQRWMPQLSGTKESYVLYSAEQLPGAI
jgi:hypothetical protein